MNRYISFFKESPLMFKALRFAAKKHKGQVRKYGGKPYVSHPIEVSKIVQEFKGNSKNLEALRIASLFHDLVEDTDTSLTEIRELFGNLVSSIVKELTSDSDKIKQIGKANYLSDKLTYDLTDYGLVIKLADRLSNTNDLDKATLEFRAKYIKETDQILTSLETKRRLTSTQKNLVAAIRSNINKWN
jgi:(p)ppGpp synthase/HD superfamily hydrolase